jgi:hypothetical protein
MKKLFDELSQQVSKLTTKIQYQLFTRNPGA